MGYWVEDKEGYVGDIASNFGMQYLRTHGPMALQHLLEKGETDSQQELDVVVEACKNSTDAEAKKAGVLLAKAQAPMMITDGTEPAD